MTIGQLPPLNTLRAFLAAARHGSFVKAGEELHVTPAAISQQVQKLEEFLGVTLFQRLPRGLVLSDAGRAALPEFEWAFAHLARGVQSLRGGGLAGSLTVSVIPSFAARWLVPRLVDFTTAYPDIEITIRSELNTVDFAHDPVDVGIRYGRGVYPGLHSALLLREEVFPVCAPTLLNGAKPLRALADIRHHTLLHDRQLSMVSEPMLSWAGWLIGVPIGEVDPNRGPGFTDALMLTEATIRGMGLSLGRTALVADDLAAGRLVRPFGRSLPAIHSYFAVTPSGREREPRIAAFLDWLERQAAESRTRFAGSP